jgi:hypothetical protein
MTFITEIEKSTLKVLWKHKRPWIAKGILSKKSNAGGITMFNYNLNFRAIAIKTAQKQLWGQVEQNRRPRYESTQLCTPNFWQSCQKSMIEKRQPRQQVLLGKPNILDPCLSPNTNVNSKWIKDLNISREYTGINKHKQWLPE